MTDTHVRDLVDLERAVTPEPGDSSVGGSQKGRKDFEQFVNLINHQEQVFSATKRTTKWRDNDMELIKYTVND